MADPRFFQKINQLTLAQVASLGEVALPDTADKERYFVGFYPQSTRGVKKHKSRCRDCAGKICVFGAGGMHSVGIGGCASVVRIGGQCFLSESGRGFYFGESGD